MAVAKFRTKAITREEMRLSLGPVEESPTIGELAIPGLLSKPIRFRSWLAIPDYIPGSVLSASNGTRRGATT